MQKSRVAPNRAVALSISILAALVALTISGVFAATAGATETRSLTSSADTQIVEYAPTQNHGAATSLGVNGNIPSGSGKDEFALVKWDLSGIAPRTQVSSALVTLSVTTASPETYRVYVLKQPWVESAVTWTVYDSGKPWEAAGARGSLDRLVTEVGSITPSVTGKNTLTLPLAVVQGWVDNPATNQGIIIRKPSSTRGFYFNSREVTDPTRRPQLTLNLSPDTTPPETTIDSGPSGTTSSGDVRFTFSSSEANSTFECRLDGATFASCTSPKDYTGLSDGLYTFEVRARDGADNVDVTPTSYTWMVDATAPTSSHTLSAPANQNGWHNANVAITLNGDDAQGSGVKELLYKMNGGTEQVAAGSSKELVISDEGTTTIGYYAVDNAGNQQAPPLGNAEIQLDKTPPTGVSGAPHRIADHNGWYNHPVDIVFDGQDSLSGNDSCSTVTYGDDSSEADGIGITVNGSCTDKAGNQSTSVASSTFKYDDTAPAAPNTLDLLASSDLGAYNDDNFTSDDTPSFSVNAEAGSTVSIYKDDDPLVLGSAKADATGVASPINSRHLDDGSYRIHATATDEAGNVSEASNDLTLTIDTQAPGAPKKLDLIADSDSGASNTDNITSDRSPAFDVSAEAESLVEIYKDNDTPALGSHVADGNIDSDNSGNKFATVTSSQLDDGVYTISARAADAAGNISLVSNDASLQVKVQSNITVDATPPDTTIDTKPAALTNSTSANFTFSSSEANSTFECRMDDEPFSACVSPKSYTALTAGDHTFSVRTRDSAGNADATPPSLSFTVAPADTTPPETTIDIGPLEGSTSSLQDVSFTFSASESGSTFECRLDGATFAPCISPKDYMGLSDGLHTFEVRATDGVGNVDPTPAVRHYSVQVPLPDTDGDGVPDAMDKCQGHPDNADVDGDGTPDGCDAQDNRDPDGDGVQNWEDNCDNEAGLASNGGCPVLSASPYPGLRFYQQVGIQPYSSYAGSAASVDNYYAQYMKPAYHGADGSVYFTVMKNLRWDMQLVNESTVPTLAQLRNHNWSGYRWNQPGGDHVAAMKSAQCVANEKCKISIQISTTATAGDATPQFMVDIGCGWVSNGLTRTRFDKPECRAYAEAWALAVLDRYANDERLGSVKLGEYFPNANAAGTPSGLDKVAYEAGYEAFLERLAADAPRDANGRRVNIHQSNPIFTNKQLVCSDMARIGIGISASDQFGFGETQTNFDCRNSLHGVVPMAVPGDQVEIVRDNSKWTWDGTPNPWGYTAGQSVTLTVPHIAWFYGHDGPMPMDQEFILAPGIMYQFQVAMDQFGPGGSLRGTLGGTPYEK